jgi:hypothetical protein
MRSFRSLFASLVLTLYCGALAAQSIALRPKNFIVTPSTGPVCEIVVRNNETAPITGTVTPGFMEGWRVAPLSREFELQPGATAVLPFAIEFGSDLAANRYPVAITTETPAGKSEIRAEVVCASTPYYKPVIDGKLGEWGDAIPLTFETQGKKTTVRSYWNRDAFFLAVEVEEERLIGLSDADAAAGMDAIQFALAPGGGDPAQRHEYLAAASASMWSADRCFLLVREGKPSEGGKLADAVLDQAAVKVRRSGGVTTYEIAVPMAPMGNLRATAGREYCFNLLVHDPDGTGVRDLGCVMNLSEADRGQNHWSDWEFVQWNGYVPYGIGVEFGFCSSIH